MAENKNAQQVREITDKLEQGIKELFESERFKEYLRTMSKFYNYSFNNTLLIAMQKPEATYVAGYTSWQRNFDRQVMKGEKGIKILAPAPYKAQEEREKIDPATQKPVIGADGKAVTETVEVLRPAFKVVSVFDVSQTDGKELPDIIVDELKGTVENYEAFFDALRQESPVPISFEDIPGGAKGFFSPVESRIAIQEGMSEIQTVKTAIHEIAHAKLHAFKPDEKAAPEDKKDRHIVTQEEFDKANEAIQRRRKTARVTHDQSDRVYYCAHCGGKLEKANGKVFACPSHRYHDGSPCEGVYWRKNALEEVLLEALKGQIEITRIESLEVKKAARIRNESLQRQLVLLKAQYDACGREKFTLYEQYREAKITAEEYLSGKDELTRKQAALKEQLEESEALYEANQQMSDAASEQQEAVGKMTGLSDAKLREHLYDAVERVLVYDSESIEIIWKFNEVKNGISSYAGAGV